jgi:hypothetical protein
LSAALVRAVQVTPSGEVITRFPEPDVATATNSPLPYVTPVQLLSAALVRLVHPIPSNAAAGGAATAHASTTAIRTDPTAATTRARTLTRARELSV